MTEKEFLDKIKLAEKRLVTEKVFNKKYQGLDLCEEDSHSHFVCDVISNHVSYEAKKEYSILFDPNPINNSFSYFGIQDRENLIHRKVSIKLFIETCLSFKLYEKF